MNKSVVTERKISLSLGFLYGKDGGIDRYQKHTKGISIDNEAPEENPQVTPLFSLPIY